MSPFLKDMVSPYSLKVNMIEFTIFSISSARLNPNCCCLCLWRPVGVDQETCR